MPELTQVSTKAAAEPDGLKQHRGIVVCVDIGETRPKNFIRELERKGFLAVHFETRTKWAVLSQLRAFVNAVRCSSFIICGTPLRSQLLWMFVARCFRRRWVLDVPMDITEWPFATRWHCRWQVKILSRLSDYVLTLKTRDYLTGKLGLRKERVLLLESCPDESVIRMGKSAQPRFQPRPGSFLICCTGCHPAHRLERFMPVFEALAKLAPNAELLFIGATEQPTIQESQRYAIERGLAERVHFLPTIKPVDEFHATVNQCDLWVATLGDDTLQGRHEFRMELLEVGMLAKPVAAVETPGLLQHQLRDGKEIIFIDAANPETSARKIAQFISEPESLARVGQQLRQLVTERFSLSEAMDYMISKVSGHR